MFYVEIEGVKALINLDIYQEVGRDAGLTKTAAVTLSDGELNIRFLHKVENPLVSAIEVFDTGGSL